LTAIRSATITEDDPPLLSDPADTLAAFRARGANTVRVMLPWSSIAPVPAADPFLPIGTAGTTVYSRLVTITVRR
jgi:hypothetical protein